MERPVIHGMRYRSLTQETVAISIAANLAKPLVGMNLISFRPFYIAFVTHLNIY